jgi:AcrR family transcriptional regulator
MAATPPKKTTTHLSEPFLRFFRRAPKQSRSRAVVDAVLVALEEQLAHTDDPNAWTLEALVDRAGVGIGSFYEYFSNKDALLGVLIGDLTERNFRTLLETIDRDADGSLETLVRTCARATASTYLERPKMLRVVLSGIARLGLHPHVVRERDRFAGELARRAAPHLPGVSFEEITTTVRALSDAAMGIVTAEVTRNESPDVDANATRLERLALAMLRDLSARGGASGAG